MAVRLTLIPSFSMLNFWSKISKHAGESNLVEYLTSRKVFSSDWAQLKAGEITGIDLGIYSNWFRKAF